MKDRHRENKGEKEGIQQNKLPKTQGKAMYIKLADQIQKTGKIIQTCIGFFN